MESQVKFCPHCNSSKNVEEFSSNKLTKDGLNTYCKICSKEKANNWYLQNKDKHLARKVDRRKDIRKRMLESAQARAKVLNIPINIKYTDIIIPEFCPVFGFKLVANKQKAGYNSPSLDRINPELGYIVGNIQVISNKANTMKNNATLAELLQFSEWIKEMING